MKTIFGCGRPFLFTALAGLGLMALTALPAHAAGASDVYRCKGDRSSVYACCSTYIRKNELLKVWKRRNRNCQTQVVCKDEEEKKCFVKKPPEDNEYCRLHPALCAGRKKSPNEESIKGGGSGGDGGNGGENNSPGRP